MQRNVRLFYIIRRVLLERILIVYTEIERKKEPHCKMTNHFPPSLFLRRSPERALSLPLVHHKMNY